MRFDKRGSRGRFSLAALLLLAAMRAAAFSDETFAFYPFTDLKPGSSGGDQTFTNAVDGAAFTATGGLYNHKNIFAKGVLTVVSDAPGQYIFDDVDASYPMPIAEGPQALHLTSGYEAGVDPTQDTDPYRYSGGYLSFANVETELSGCSEFTIEFFWKIDTAERDERYQCSYDSAFQLNRTSANWLTSATDSTVRKIGLAFPLESGATDKRNNLIALYDELTPWGGNYCTYPSAISHDAWHHLALVFKNGMFTVWGDYTYWVTRVGKTGEGAETAGYALKQITESVPFCFGMGRNGYVGFHGKVSCFRFSRKALETSRFMRASNNPHYYVTRPSVDPVVMGGETVAYYTFKEGEGNVGASALSARLVNDVDTSKYDGAFSTQASCGGVTYDDDRPGTYVFDSFASGATACVTNPYSLCFTRPTDGSSKLTANLKFRNLATALASSDERTIEFFYKLTESAIVPDKYAETQMMAFQSSYTNVSDGATVSTALWLPCGNIGQVPKQVRFSKRDWPAIFAGSYSYADTLADGKWHHVAVTGTGTNYTLYVDYGQPQKAVISGVAKADVASSLPLELGLDHFAGKISCLRVSTKVLTTDEMLHVSMLETCKPADTLWYRFEDGAVDAEVGNSGAVSTPRTFADFNPQLFHWPVTYPAGTGYSSGESRPTFADRTWWTKVGESGSVENLAFETNNTRSAHFVTVPKASETVTFASGNYVRAANESTIDGSMTMELFAKFDYGAFVDHIGSRFGETRDRVALMSHEVGGGYSAWKLYLQNVTKTSASIVLGVRHSDKTEKTFTYKLPSPSSIRSRWHRYAVVYDKENLKVAVYFDGAKVIDGTLEQALAYKESAAYYQFGSGGNNQPFDGWMDEIRLSTGVLDPSEFLRPSSPRGSILIVQ